MALISSAPVWGLAVLTVVLGLVAARHLGRGGGALRRVTSALLVVLTAALLSGTLAASANVHMGWFRTGGDLWRTMTGHGAPLGDSLPVEPLPAPGEGHTAGTSDAPDAPLPQSLSGHPGSPAWTTSFAWDSRQRAWTAKVRGPASGLDREVTVWTPPGYSPTSRTTYDVVVFLHGFPGSNVGVTRSLDVGATIDGLMAHGELRPTILVVADLSMGGLPPDCVDVRGRAAVETFLTQDLVQSVRTNFPNVSGWRSGWLIGGISAGAYCASVLYLRHQDQFWGAVAMSGYDTPELGVLSHADRSVREAFTVSHMLASTDRSSARMWLSGTPNDGDAMGLLGRATRAARPGDDITVHVDLTGGHSWRTWAGQFPLALRWWTQGVADEGASGPRSAVTQPFTAPPSSQESTWLTRTFGLAGWGTLWASVLVSVGLLGAVVLLAPRTGWTGRARLWGHLVRLVGVGVVSAALCLCVIIVVNRSQGFFSSWGDLLDNWSMFF